MFQESSVGTELCWTLLYTKPQCEFWAEANLRKQGYDVLLPRVTASRGIVPLFPRYVFAGSPPERAQRSLNGTFGVSRVILFGDRPARVPIEVIEEIRARMDAHGMVLLDSIPRQDSMFAKRERERRQTMAKLVQAGFRVRAA